MTTWRDLNVVVHSPRLAEGEKWQVELDSTSLMNTFLSEDGEMKPPDNSMPRPRGVCLFERRMTPEKQHSCDSTTRWWGEG